MAAHLALAAGNGKGDEAVVAGRFVSVSARAGEVALRIGLARSRPASVASASPSPAVVVGGGGTAMDVDLDVDGEKEELDPELCKMGREVADECRGMGGTLEAVGRVIEACLSDSILTSKYVSPSPPSLPSLPLPRSPLSPPTDNTSKPP